MSYAINPRDPALNYVVVNGVQSPGRAQLTGVAAPYKYDVQEGYGLSGATTIFRGRGVARFTLTISLWRPEHFIAWPFFAALLEPPKTSKPLVVQMRHPLLSMADIEAVAVESLGAPERQSNGVWTATISLLEYRPPKPALVKPRGAIPSPEKGAPVTPQTEADKALVVAQAELAAARGATP